MEGIIIHCILHVKSGGHFASNVWDMIMYQKSGHDFERKTAQIIWAELLQRVKAMFLYLLKNHWCEERFSRRQEWPQHELMDEKVTW